MSDTKNISVMVAFLVVSHSRVVCFGGKVVFGLPEKSFLGLGPVKPSCLFLLNITH